MSFGAERAFQMLHHLRLETDLVIGMSAKAKPRIAVNPDFRIDVNVLRTTDTANFRQARDRLFKIYGGFPKNIENLA
jgi:hypothetical protein